MRLRVYLAVLVISAVASGLGSGKVLAETEAEKQERIKAEWEEYRRREAELDAEFHEAKRRNQERQRTQRETERQESLYHEIESYLVQIGETAEPQLTTQCEAVVDKLWKEGEPNHVGRVRASVYYEALGKMDKAFDLLQETAKMPPDQSSYGSANGHKMRCHIRLAHLAIRMGDADGALAALDSLSEMEDPRSQVWLQLLKLLKSDVLVSMKGNAEDALAILQEVRAETDEYAHVIQMGPVVTNKGWAEFLTKKIRNKPDLESWDDLNGFSWYSSLARVYLGFLRGNIDDVTVERNVPEWYLRCLEKAIEMSPSIVHRDFLCLAIACTAGIDDREVQRMTDERARRMMEMSNSPSEKRVLEESLERRSKMDFRPLMRAGEKAAVQLVQSGSYLAPFGAIALTGIHKIKGDSAKMEEALGIVAHRFPQYAEQAAQIRDATGVDAMMLW